MNAPRLAIVVIAACMPAPNRNEAVGHLDRTHVTWRAPISSATFDGKLVRIALGSRLTVVIASCYAHAQQQIGDHDHVQIELDGTSATTGELDITDCLSTHIVATLDATFADGTRVRADFDTELVHR